jgi:hypothetical protein
MYQRAGEEQSRRKRSSANGKVRPNGKQSRRSITHANSWSVRLTRRLNDFLATPFRLETRLRTTEKGRRRKVALAAAAAVLHLIVARRSFKLFLNQFEVSETRAILLSVLLLAYFSALFFFFDTVDRYNYPADAMARLPKFIRIFLRPILFRNIAS